MSKGIKYTSNKLTSRLPKEKGTCCMTDYSLQNFAHNLLPRSTFMKS